MMDDKLLINLVRDHPILYNSSHVNYMDVGMKLAIWKEIGAKMNRSGEKCKARWNNIRDNYKKSLKKLREQRSLKPYRFAWDLSFLKKYLDERELKGNQNVTVTENNISEEDGRNSQSLSELLEEERAEEDKRSGPMPGCEVLLSEPKTKPLALRKRKLVRESPSTMLMKYLLERKSAQGTANKGESGLDLKHPVDSFLLSLAPTLKSLPLHLLTLAKSEIFACVQKYEMMRHTPEGNSFTAMNNTDVEASQEAEEEDTIQEPLIHETEEKRSSKRERPESVPSTSPTPVEPPPKKQKHSDLIESPNELLKSACELLSSCKQTEDHDDEYQYIAKLWTCKLKALVSMQKRLAERAINEILFEADLGTLHRNSVQINFFHDPTSVTTRHSSDISAVRSKSVMGPQTPCVGPASSSHSSTLFSNAILFDKTDHNESSL